MKIIGGLVGHNPPLISTLGGLNMPLPEIFYDEKGDDGDNCPDAA